MNQEEILNMPAGREIDLLIAEMLFSWQWFPANGMMYFRPVEKFAYGAIKDGESIEYMSNLPSYSTDISSAFEVAEKLSDKWDFAIVNNQNFGKYPDLHYGFRLQAIGEDSHIKTIFALGETASLAICRAALLAVVPAQQGGV